VHCTALAAFGPVPAGPIGATEADVGAATQQQIERTPPPTRMPWADYRQLLQSRGHLVGGVGEIIDGLGQLAEAGAQASLFVYSPHVLRFLAAEIVPQAAKL
jgi:X-X-X-Leu-X-X-Gly heptad repeat protein